MTPATGTPRPSSRSWTASRSAGRWTASSPAGPWRRARCTGKTLETLALICHARQADPGGAPFLVVAPTSVAPNWAAEAARFAPGLTVVTIADTLARRGAELSELIAGADLVVTSYTLLRLDLDAHAAAEWSGLILDEAQYTKNHLSKIYQCARRLPAPFKVAITGTPMENNLMATSSCTGSSPGTRSRRR